MLGLLKPETLIAALLGLVLAPCLAEAQQQAAPALSGDFFTGTLWFFVIGLVGYYVLVTRPMVLKEEAHKKFLDGLKKNDEVITSGGIFGRVAGVKAEYVTIEIAPSVRIQVAPEHIKTPPKQEQPLKHEAAAKAGDKPAKKE